MSFYARCLTPTGAVVHATSSYAFKPNRDADGYVVDGYTLAGSTLCRRSIGFMLESDTVVVENGPRERVIWSDSRPINCRRCRDVIQDRIAQAQYALQGEPLGVKWWDRVA